MANQGKGPSFKTDVNRNPTKKWTTAASYSYDGGDWDGYDEYDDTPPAPKPTGLRQKGQASTDPNRNFTAPEASNVAAAAAARTRASSFETGDERRTFSSGHSSMPAAPKDSSGLRQSTAPQPARGAINSYPPPVSLQTNLPSVSVAPQIRPQRQGTGSTSRQSSTTDSPSVYSAATVGSLPGRGITGASPTDMFASPVSASAEGASAPFLAPRSNLSQAQAPPSAQYIAELDAGPHGSAPQPPTEADPASAATEEHVPKAFIRPADIYKRLDQEREKERRSSESSRPSVDSTGRPTSRQLEPGPRTSSSPMRNVVTVPTSHEATHPATYSTYELPGETFGAPAAFTNADLSRGGQMSQPGTNTETYANSEATATSATTPSEAPKLPNLLRFSGFGLGPDMMWPTTSAEAPPPIPAGIAASAASTTAEQPLKHQSSTGFRSAINEAFEAGNDNLLTPASVRGSQRSAGESEVSVHGTNSTSGISPIMSSVPTGSSTLPLSRDGDMGSSSTPTIPEDTQEASAFSAPQHGFRSESISTLKGTEWGQERGHSRVTSGDSSRTAVGPTSGDMQQSTSPSTIKSPARSADVRMSGEITSASVAQIHNVASLDGSSGITDADGLAPRHDLSTREADVAAAVNAGNDEQTPTDNDDMERRPRSRESSVASWASSRERSQSPQKNQQTISDRSSNPVATGLRLDSPKTTEGETSSNALESSPGNAASRFVPTSPSEQTDEDVSTNEEHDQLTHDILHSLTPSATEYTVPPPPPIPESPTYRGGARESTMSTILPREYDSYWAADSPTSPADSASRQNSPMVAKFPQNASNATAATAENSADQRGTQLTDPAAQFHDVPRPGVLDRKFSWEDPAEEATAAPTAPVSDGPDAQPNVPDADDASSRPAPQHSHSSFIRDSSEFAELDAEQARHFEGPDGERIEMIHTSASFGPSMSPTAYELGGFDKDSSNSLMNVPPKPEKDSDDASFNSSEQGFEDAPAEPITSDTTRAPAPVPTFTFAPPVQAMGFKEIVAIKKTGDRIDMFNRTRSQHAAADSGLDSWLGYMIHHNPAFGNMPPPPKPSVSTAGGAGGGAGGSPTGAVPGRSSTLAVRASSAQMSAKGKDLLHSAGVFGGKATHGAKGLFAKGKSKLRAVSSEKVRIGNRSISNPSDSIPSTSSVPQSSTSSIPYTLTPATSAGPSVQLPPPPYDSSRPRMQPISDKLPMDNAPIYPVTSNAPLTDHKTSDFIHHEPEDQPIDDDRSYISGDDRPPVPPKSVVNARVSTLSESPTLVPSMDEIAQSTFYPSHYPNKSVSRPVSQMPSHEETDGRSYELQQSVSAESRPELSYTSSNDMPAASTHSDTLAPQISRGGSVSPISPGDYTPTSLSSANFSPHVAVPPQLPPADINTGSLSDDYQPVDDHFHPSTALDYDRRTFTGSISPANPTANITRPPPTIVEPTAADTTHEHISSPPEELHPPSYTPPPDAHANASPSDTVWPQDVKDILGMHSRSADHPSSPIDLIHPALRQPEDDAYTTPDSYQPHPWHAQANQDRILGTGTFEPAYATYDAITPPSASAADQSRQLGYQSPDARTPPSPQPYGYGYPSQSWRLQHQRMSFTPPPLPVDARAYHVSQAGPSRNAGATASASMGSAPVAGAAVTTKTQRRRSGGVLKKANPKEGKMRSVSADMIETRAGGGSSGGGGRAFMEPVSPGQEVQSPGKKKRLSGFGLFKD